MDSKRIRVEAKSVRQLFKWMEERRFALPKVQRAFVWNGKKAAALFDSIYKQIPVGTPVLWVAHGDLRYHIRETLHILPLFSPQNEDVWFIVDGQQRLSTLYRASLGDVVSVGRRKVDFGQVVFNLDPDEDEPDFAYRKPLHSRWMPVRDILSPSWSRLSRKLPEAARVRISQCRSRVLSYELPIIKFESAEVAEAQELFVRINSLGTRISGADEVFSKATGLELRELVHKTVAASQPGFNNLDEMPLLALMGFLQGATDIRKQSIEVQLRKFQRTIDSKEQRQLVFAEKWKKIERSVHRSIQHLKDKLGVVDSTLLPSEYMASVLAVYFHFKKGNPSKSDQKLIERWFWVTGLAARYSGRGYYQNILADMRAFRRLAEGGNAQFSLKQAVDPAVFLRVDYRDGKSLTKTYFCLLFAKKPRFLDTGDVVPASDVLAMVNQQHRHHIFPQSQLRWVDVRDKRINCLANICLLCGSENQSISNDLPCDYLKEVNEHRFATTMGSHLIPHDKKSGLWEENIDAGFEPFLRARAAAIRHEFERRTGLKGLFKEE